MLGNENNTNNGAELVTLQKRVLQAFDRIVVIGGGCYGSWYVQQLLRARIAGALAVNEIVVVDRNANCKVLRAINSGEISDPAVQVITSTWSEYLTSWFALGAAALQSHALVPSPLMPHLLLDWLVERAALRWPDRRVQVQPLVRPPRIPWERAAPDGRHYVSFAEWLCPTNCVEPALCPATGGPRSWSMPPALQAYVAAVAEQQPLNGPVVFHCVHRTHGIGMIDAAAVAVADEQIARWGALQFPQTSVENSLDVLVGTVSHCHGALGVLSVR